MGGSDFVEEILAYSGEHYERRYDLVRRRYDLDRIAARVAEILEIQPDEMLSKGRNRKEVVATVPRLESCVTIRADRQ